MLEMLEMLCYEVFCHESQGFGHYCSIHCTYGSFSITLKVIHREKCHVVK